MIEQKCSLRSIAKASGFSAATVSMALRGMARVPMETRLSIQETAAAMGYVRDAEMAQFMSKARRQVRAKTREQLAFLGEVSIKSTPGPTSPWLNEMFHAAQKTAHLLGYELEPFRIDLDAASQAGLSRKLWSRGIRGMLVGPITTWHPAELSLEWKHFAAVELGSTINKPGLHRVERGFYDDLLDSYEHLRVCGYRRIGLALPHVRLDFMRHMPEATLLYFEKQHEEMEPVVPMPMSHAWSPSGLKSWLRDQRPDVLIVYEPDVPAWLAKAKIRIPQDLGVFHLHAQSPKQSGLTPDVQLLAREAIHLLVRMVEGGEWGIPSRSRSHRFKNLFNRGETISDQSAIQTERRG